MADEIDAGQARGEIASKGRGRDNSNPHAAGISTLNELAVDDRRPSEWRDCQGRYFGSSIPGRNVGTRNVARNAKAS
jgi:hypothetical protein